MARNSSGVAVDPAFMVSWIPEILKVRTVTEEGTAPTSGKGDSGAASGSDKKADDGKPAADAEKTATREEKPARTYLRGLNVPANEERPVLVYFHWPHDDGDRGRDIQKFCNGALEEEEFARVSHLFYCVEVNTRDTAPRIVAEAGVKDTPTMLLCRADGEILWRTAERGASGKAIAANLKAVLKKTLPEEWKSIEEEMEVQKEFLRKAVALKSKADSSDDDVLFELNGAVNSRVRFGPAYDTALKLLRETEKEIAEKAQKEKDKKSAK